MEGGLGCLRITAKSHQWQEGAARSTSVTRNWWAFSRSSWVAHTQMITFCCGSPSYREISSEKHAQDFWQHCLTWGTWGQSLGLRCPDEHRTAAFKTTKACGLEEGQPPLWGPQSMGGLGRMDLVPKMGEALCGSQHGKRAKHFQNSVKDKLTNSYYLSSTFRLLGALHTMREITN